MCRDLTNSQCALLVAAWFLLGGGGAGVHAAEDPGEDDSPAIDRASLVNRRFEFSWSSDGGGGVNGIATLEADGSIEGIHSPNETTWLVDAAGRLIFKHADGRISTRYDEVRRVDGLLCFTGSFLFRAGITHHLIETESTVLQRVHEMTPALAARITYSTQRFVYLDIGESFSFQLGNGTEKRIRLISVEEYKDPVIDLMRRAVVKVEIDGKAIELVCAPYVMPTVTGGLRIQADTTSAWLKIPKRVQFSLWDAADPIVDTNRFGFPLPDYRLFSHGMQAYNEPVHLGHRDGDPAGQRFYHNYGVDFAGYEGRQKVRSCIDGVVVQADSRSGDLSIQDDQGFIVYFGHLDAILSDVRVGAAVKRGQWVGMLGRRGASGNFSHLHVGYVLDASQRSSNRTLNLYPWLVTAYEAEHGAELRAVARPHKTVLTGDSVRFDGTSSLGVGASGASFTWKFHDSTSADGPEAEKVYEKAGCYIATLWIKDRHGHTDVDFCKVKVFSRPDPEKVVPTLFVTYTPSAEVFAEQPVSFRIWPQGGHVADIRVDFGDGMIVEDYRPYSAIIHTYANAGIHIVTVTGRAGGLPVAQKTKVVVRDMSRTRRRR